jgi:hypothetical protein
MNIAAITNRKAKYIILRSVGSKHPGFPIRNRSMTTKGYPIENKRWSLKPGYEIVGYANNDSEIKAILFPN